MLKKLLMRFRAGRRFKSRARVYTMNMRRPLSFDVPPEWYEKDRRHLTRLSRLSRGYAPFRKPII